MLSAVIRFARRRPRNRKIARRSAAPAASEAKRTDADAAVPRIPPDAPAPHFLRRPPVDQKMKKPSKRRARMVEVAGGTTAECAVICCCCPCGLINILVLSAVRLPTGLFRRALRKRILLKRTKKRAALLDSGSSDNSKSVWSTTEDEELTRMPGTRVVMVVGDSWPIRSPTEELRQLEKEVWSKFYRSGFWRTPSERELQTASQLNGDGPNGH